MDEIEPFTAMHEVVMVMGDADGWKVELWARDGMSSVTIAAAPTADECEDFATVVREILATHMTFTEGD